MTISDVTKPSSPQLLAASHILIIGSLGLCVWVVSLESRILALLVLGIGTILLDVGITTDQTLGRRAVNLPNVAA
jgi:hypothetical protein